MSQTPSTTAPTKRLRKRPDGNVNALMLATAFVIASMWLMFHNSESQRSFTPPAIAASDFEASRATSALADYTSAIADYVDPVDELVVTAPRVKPKTVTFERPAKDVVPTKPVPPQEFWQSPS